MKPEKITIKDLTEFAAWCEEKGVICNFQLGFVGAKNLEKVTKCVECKWFRNFDQQSNDGECTLHNILVDHDDFCSDGERKEENEE